eukprot:6095915-Prymnesium_polylepis.1
MGFMKNADPARQMGSVGQPSRSTIGRVTSLNMSACSASRTAVHLRAVSKCMGSERLVAEPASTGVPVSEPSVEAKCCGAVSLHTTVG